MKCRESLSHIAPRCLALAVACSVCPMGPAGAARQARLSRTSSTPCITIFRSDYDHSSTRCGHLPFLRPHAMWCGRDWAAAHRPIHYWIHTASYTAQHGTARFITVSAATAALCCMCSAQLHSATPTDSWWKHRLSREPDGHNNIHFNRNRACCASVTLKTRNRIVSSSFFFLSHPFFLHAIAARVSMLPPAPCRSITNNFANIFDSSTGHFKISTF